MAGKRRRTSYGLRQPTRSRGVALVVALAVVIILLSIVLVFAREMQTSATVARNQLAASQARHIAEGAARAIAAELQRSYDETGTPTLEITPVEAGRIGDGLYWVIDPLTGDDDATHTFGLVRESGKANLNTASREALALLPGMDSALAAVIVDWRDGDTDVTADGAESITYLARRPAYRAKDGPIESIDELLLLRDFDREIVFGEDANQNGVLDDFENDGGLLDPPDDADGTLDRGLAAYVTVFSREPTAVPGGGDRADVNANDARPLFETLQGVVSSERLNVIAGAIVRTRPHGSVLQAMVAAEVTPEEAASMEGRLAVGTVDQRYFPGLIDVSSAPVEVLATIPGMEEGDADRLVAARQGGADLSSLLWVADALGRDNPQKLGQVGRVMTSRCFQFSADIVAVSGDGRAFCRLNVVIDVADGTARIVRVTNRTAMGWPLDPQLLEDLRSGVTADDIALDRSIGAGS